MKTVGNKIFIFYHFQLDSSRDYNVTAIPNNGQSPTIKDILTILPFDISHGLFHFRFKSELADGDEKVLGWIDINNIMAKVPQVNGSIYIKILKLKDSNYNKLFHLEKLKKAEVIKNIPNHNHANSAPKTPNSNGVPNIQSGKSQPPNQNQQQRVTPSPQQQKITPNPQQNANTTSLLEPVSNFIPQQSKPQAEIIPQKPKLVTTSIQQNLQTFEKQFKSQEENRENQRLAQIELEERIRKWGYTDMKKINNTTTLLATLHQIWPEWEAVSLTDMLKPEQMNAVFKKAAVKLHPDKNRNRHFKEKYLSKRVFELLNESRKHT